MSHFMIPDDLNYILHEDGSITIEPDTKHEVTYNYEFLMSMPALAKYWGTPEEDNAWEHLQNYKEDARHTE